MHVYLYDDLGVLFGPVTLEEIPGLGRPLPSNGVESDTLLPLADDGKVWVLTDGVPVQVADHRGTVYSVETGMAEEWNKPGDLPSEYTLIPFPGPHFVWNGTDWALDVVASVQAQRNQLLEAANKATVGMTDAYIAGLLSQEDEVTFKAFATYKVALAKIEKQPGYPDTIDWPTSP
jgi:hypothetical protein